MFCWGNGNLRAWALHQNGSLQYLACSAEVASAQSPVPPGGMPSGMISVSASQGVAETGVVWASYPYKDANQMVSPAGCWPTTRRRSASSVNGPASCACCGTRRTGTSPSPTTSSTAPYVFNGRVYVPTYDDRVDV